RLAHAYSVANRGITLGDLLKYALFGKIHAGPQNLLAVRLFVGGLLRPLRQTVQKWIRAVGSVNGPRQRSFEWNHSSIKFARAVFVLTDARPRQAYPGKYAAGPRIGQDLCPHLPISIRGRMPANRTGSYGGIRAQLKFARKQVSHALVVHDEHHKIDRLPSHLEPETASLH